MGDVTIGIATFGSQGWLDLAQSRAIPSAVAQGVPVIHRHHDTLAKARNAVLKAADTEFLISLDADDELEPGYVEAMLKGSADVRAPAIRQVREYQDGRLVGPFIPKVGGRKHRRHACHAECLRDGNFVVIGAMARTELMRRAGGWEEFGWSEDWAMWARCWMAGGTVEVIPDAVYRAHVRLDSRNHAPSSEVKEYWHRQIEAAVWPDAAAAA